METINQISLQNKWYKTVYPWVVWIMGASFFFYKYLVQVSPSVMTTDLMKAFHINAAGLGNLSAFYFYAYLFMQIPVGMLLDKYSPRLLTTIAILVCSISTFVFSQTNILGLACFARAMIGAGAAFSAVSCFKLATVWFSPKRFALVSGLCMTAAMLGGVGGQMPLSILVQSHGWREALEIISIVGILLSVAYYFIVRDKSMPNFNPQNKTVPITQNLFSVLKNPQTWLLSLYSGLAFAPVSVFGGLWGVPFLQTVYQLPRHQSALAVSFIFIGFAIGAPFFGWLSDYIGKRKPVLFLGAATALTCISIVLYSQTSFYFILCAYLFFFGFGASGFFTSFAMIRELFPLMLGGTVLGIMNTFDSVCEALFEPLVGAFLDMTWTGQMFDGVRQFTAQGYHVSLFILPVALIIAILLLFFIQETNCIPIEEKTTLH